MNKCVDLNILSYFKLSVGGVTMKKIGEISKRYNVSNRMLRYYEKVGIISSTRRENNYRYYTEESERKLTQILLLKELNFTLKEIEYIYKTKSTFDLIKIMYQKQAILKENIINQKKLDQIITHFIELLNESQHPFFDSLELCLRNPSKNWRGKNSMTNENVRIITVPRMKVAVFNCVSETPEEDCWKEVNNFISKNKLTSFRHFGFNNPNPQEGKTEYGYEMWVTVPDDFYEKGVQTREVNEALYASLTTTMDSISRRWNELHKLINNHELYDVDFLENDVFGVSEHQWLEECINYKHFIDPDIHFSEKQLDLLLPIKTK